MITIVLCCEARGLLIDNVYSGLPIIHQSEGRQIIAFVEKCIAGVCGIILLGSGGCCRSCCTMEEKIATCRTISYVLYHMFNYNNTAQQVRVQLGLWL